MKFVFQICLWLLLCLGLLPAWAQKQKQKKPSAKPEDTSLAGEQKPEIFADTVASDKREEREKKLPKRLYYGEKTKKRYTKKGSRNKLTLELFYVLKKFREPDPYLTEISEVYWFDAQKKKVMKGPIPPKKLKYAGILHGPYERYVNRELIEEGVFFFGTKHGRWEGYATDEDNTLLVKEKYRWGWPMNTEVTYYDGARQMVKEVFPYDEWGRLNGTYYKFFENGGLAVQGKYENSQKVGVWVEFYDFKRRRHKEFQYPENAAVEAFEPYLLREYDRSSKLIYDYSKDGKVKAGK